jgi:hypothetical protein
MFQLNRASRQNAIIAGCVAAAILVTLAVAAWRPGRHDAAAPQHSTAPQLPDITQIPDITQSPDAARSPDISPSATAVNPLAVRVNKVVEQRRLSLRFVEAVFEPDPDASAAHGNDQVVIRVNASNVVAEDATLRDVPFQLQFAGRSYDGQVPDPIVPAGRSVDTTVVFALRRHFDGDRRAAVAAAALVVGGEDLFQATLTLAAAEGYVPYDRNQPQQLLRPHEDTTAGRLRFSELHCVMRGTMVGAPLEVGEDQVVFGCQFDVQHTGDGGRDARIDAQTVNLITTSDDAEQAPARAPDLVLRPGQQQRGLWVVFVVPEPGATLWRLRLRDRDGTGRTEFFDIAFGVNAA